MDEYIKRQDAVDCLWANCDEVGSAIVPGMEAIPAADARPVVRSRWEICCDGYYPYCMNCKSEPPGRIMTDFCPICGADMRGEAET